MTTPDVLPDPLEAEEAGVLYFDRITEAYDLAVPDQRMELMAAWRLRLRLAVLVLQKASRPSVCLETVSADLEKTIGLVGRVEESIFKHHLAEFQKS